MKNKTRVKIKEIADFNFGYHISEIQNQGILYLQAKNFDENGLYLDNVENFIDKDTIKEEHLLRDGDILLVGKGMRFFAYKYEQSIGKAIASSIFYLIRVDQDRILPDYLTCILNHSKSHKYFNSIGAGSSIPSIRKNELADYEIALPALEMQSKIVNIYNLHKYEIQLIEKVKQNNLIRFNQMINEITK
ncbi:restriction endonuclease subunit S [Myroides odoratimimus]|uniref:restriction endonuclease subunit S n=1 Tax=Myroides odoratimimus TaxID=76832 RepID=UPI00257897D3|nr:restriction endonuclease subunit S [Myroides odoratimimus]MDM1461328.1 restriction endonuclease subunit S [Myroides odoratimimus]